LGAEKRNEKGSETSVNKQKFISRSAVELMHTQVALSADVVWYGVLWCLRCYHAQLPCCICFVALLCPIVPVHVKRTINHYNSYICRPLSSICSACPSFFAGRLQIITGPRPWPASVYLPLFSASGWTSTATPTRTDTRACPPCSLSWWRRS
jgi:hypothetical protein